MADAPVRELPPAVRHEALSLIESSLREEQIIWRKAGMDAEQLRAVLVATTHLAALLARGAAAGRKVSPQEVIASVRARI